MTEAKKFFLSAIVIIVLAIAGFLFWYVSRYSMHAITATHECLDIFKEKSTEYFGDAGKNRFVFNQKMNTCLLLNTLDDTTAGEYRLVLVDMIQDAPLFYYDLKQGETKDATLGLTKDQALDKMRSYRFVIF